MCGYWKHIQAQVSLERKIVVAIMHFMDRLRVKGLQLEGRVQGTVLTILYISCLCNN